MAGIAWTALGLAALPAVLFCVNLLSFRRLPASRPGGATRPVSVLVPARDEEASIGECLASLCSQVGVELEILVADDHSTDRTAAVVAEWARRDSRVSLVPIPELPDGWCGKQHACAELAARARHEILVFIDADVRLEARALARLCDAITAAPPLLLSGFPRQVTQTWVEKSVLPLMHVLLLGFLPIVFMRRSIHPAFGAGCGQLFATARHAYERAGGHAAIRSSRHDGITLPRAYRRAGVVTDVCDATDLARCRMYHGSAAVWFGLAKNATEGLASPRAIVPWSVVLLGGQVLPGVLALAAWRGGAGATVEPVLLAAAAASYLPRWIAACKFRQSLLGALLHPLGVALLVAIQWYALVRDLRGGPALWKGRPAASRVRTAAREDEA